DELAPHKQPRREQRHDADGGEGGEPALELLVLRLVGSAGAGLVADADHGVGDEQVDGHKDAHEDPDGEDDGAVDHVTIGGDGGEPPGAENMEKDGGDHQCNEDKRDGHRRYSPTLRDGARGCRDKLQRTRPGGLPPAWVPRVRLTAAPAHPVEAAAWS